MRADHAPTDDTSIDDLLARLDETVTIHQRWNRLAATIRTWRQQELALGNECARSAAAAYGRALRQMGVWDDEIDGPSAGGDS